MTSEFSTVDQSILVRRALRGDQPAVDAIVQLFVDDVYSFCRSAGCGVTEASKVTQRVFLRAMERLGTIENTDHLRAWFVAIAYRELADRRGESTMVRHTASERDVGDLADANHSSELWSIGSAELSSIEHAWSELRCRHLFDEATAARVLDVSAAQAGSLERLLDDRLQQVFGPLLVARSGRGRCDALMLLLGPWAGDYTASLRSQVNHHVANCAACRATATQPGSQVAAGTVLTVAAAPSSVRAAVMVRLGEAFAATSASGGNSGNGPLGYSKATAVLGAHPAWSWRPDGFPAAKVASHGLRARIVLIPAMLAVAVAGIAVCLLGADAPEEVETVEVPAVDVAGAVEDTQAGRLLGDGSGGVVTPEKALVADAIETEVSSTTESAVEPSGERTDETERSVQADGTPTPTSATETAESSSSSATSVSSSSTSPSSTRADVSPGTSSSPSTRTPSAAETTTTTRQTTTTIESRTTRIATTSAPTTTRQTVSSTTTNAPTTTPPTTSTSTTTSTTSSTTSTTSTTTTSTTTTSTTTAPPANQPPTFGASSVSPDKVDVSRGACSGSVATVSVAVDDPDGSIANVVAIVDLGDGESTRTLVSTGSGVFAAEIGPWSLTGNQSIDVRATDDDGETASLGLRVRVKGCSGRPK